MSGPLERGKDWGCGVGELVTHVHVHVQIVGPRGMGRFMQVFYFYIFLSSSFLPFFLLVPVELPHLVKYMSSTYCTYCTCNILLSVVDWVHLRGNR